MSKDAIKMIEADFYKKRPDMKVGDLVKVHIKISEKGKERIQIFEGIVIAMKGTGLNKTFTVRKISYGVGVEKIFPVHSPSIAKIEVVRRGKVRRSKLYYMRKKVGKQAMKIVNAKNIYMTDEEEEAVETETNEKEVESAEKTEPVTDEKEVSTEEKKEETEKKEEDK